MTDVMGKIMGEINHDDSDARHSFVCTLLIALGIALIIVSWTPIGRVASQAIWTNEDSAAYSKLHQQRHHAAYQSPARAGITEAEMKAQQERLKTRAEAMRKKLEYARQQPRRWSQYLLWSGALLAAVGGLGLLACRTATN